MKSLTIGTITRINEVLGKLTKQMLGSAEAGKAAWGVFIAMLAFWLVSEKTLESAVNRALDIVITYFRLDHACLGWCHVLGPRSECPLCPCGGGKGPWYETGATTGDTALEAIAALTRHVLDEHVGGAEQESLLQEVQPQVLAEVPG